MLNGSESECEPLMMTLALSVYIMFYVVVHCMILAVKCHNMTNIIGHTRFTRVLCFYCAADEAAGVSTKSFAEDVFLV